MSVHKTTTRRRFIKMFALTAACGASPQGEWGGTLLGDIQPQSRPGVGLVRLTLSDFPTLANELGSVRVGTSSLAGDFPRGLFYPILINRAAANHFYALSSECTHEGCVVRPFSRTANASQCPCHQSRFAIDGRVISGPAFFPLLSYPIAFDGVNRLTIEIPDFPHEINGRIVQSSSTGKSRVRLDFFAYLGMEFEILFRESLSSSWQAVSFSTTQEGPIGQATLTGNDKTALVYLDRQAQTGFYAVAIRVKQV
jgi:Rieske Fe-S protein